METQLNGLVEKLSDKMFKKDKSIYKITKVFTTGTSLIWLELTSIYDKNDGVCFSFNVINETLLDALKSENYKLV